MPSPDSKRRIRRKPSKPTPMFPLTPHGNGQWCKKIRGKVHFFGVWEDPQKALGNYLRVAADLHAGRQPKESSLSPDGVTVKEVANHFLTEQMRRTENKEIGAIWFHDCLNTARHFCRFVGAGRLVDDVRPEEFQQYRNQLIRRGLTGKRGLGPYSLDRSIIVVKSMFDHAYQNELIDRPVRFGRMFRQSSALEKRRARAEQQVKYGKRMLAAGDILRLLEVAEPAMRAMILLGINGGMGNTDCALLPISAIDRERALIEFPRPKTGVERVVALWPETLRAIEEAIKARPKPATAEHAGLVFLTVRGRPWVRQIIEKKDGQIEKVTRVDPLGEEFEKLLKRLGLKRKGLGFYALRHGFQTWADETRDEHAVSRIMGHLIRGMSAHYIEEIELPRIRAVSDFVRNKLFAISDSNPGAQSKADLRSDEVKPDVN